MAAPTSTFRKGDRVRVKNEARPFAGDEGPVISQIGDFVEVVLENAPVASVLYRADELERVEGEKP